MKKIICVILLVIFTILFCGCGSKNYIESERFILVSGGNPNIIADKETGVMYLVMYKPYQFGITPLLNTDGSPMCLNFG